MKIADYVRLECLCGKCIHGANNGAIPLGRIIDCAATDRSPWSGDIRTCGAWYLAVTRPPNPELIGDREHTLIAVHDFPSWCNLYQCPKPPQIRVLSREEWPEIKPEE